MILGCRSSADRPRPVRELEPALRDCCRRGWAPEAELDAHAFSREGRLAHDKRLDFFSFRVEVRILDDRRATPSRPPTSRRRLGPRPTSPAGASRGETSASPAPTWPTAGVDLARGRRGGASRCPAQSPGRQAGMEARISLVTLGVGRRGPLPGGLRGARLAGPGGRADRVRASGRARPRALGTGGRWRTTPASSTSTRGRVRGDRPGLANVRSRSEVDAVLEEAVRAGATVHKPAAETFYGGYAAWFADPDGHLWGGRPQPGVHPHG